MAIIISLCVYMLLVECVKLCVEKQYVIQCVEVEVFQLRLAACRLFLFFVTVTLTLIATQFKCSPCVYCGYAMAWCLFIIQNG